MDRKYTILKVLNNNVIIARDPALQEVVLIGKGIGFSKKSNDILDGPSVDKLYILHDMEEQQQYKQLLSQVDESFILVMNEVIFYSENQLGVKFNEHIHIALTDHIAFALKRIQQGIDITNPFSKETELLYPKEYTVAEEVVKLIEEETGVHLPEGEIGFIALHLHSAATNRSISKLNRNSQLINSLIQLIEQHLDISIDRSSMDYLRLVQHLRHGIDRIEREEQVGNQDKLAKVLKEEYPVCYNLAWKLMKVMQQKVGKHVSDAEAVYLTMHLQRLSPQ
ncbi:glucose PTS transporter transcription antiterminator GlcT [Pseudalkalibacillus salsuginis]|uniref:glucose PTS transporter transcription antiterminator GlcT n=1 Tax=Pseudalkalibacillus salsuginis TaxID=2910972 RepID=UPI001F35B23E|nr:transcription antiterminator [Pseudalkalibacillus salsuginis]MCF6408700.1 transcription antiterminator [Pseudalkalibacillus salsuginis]